MLLQGCYSLCNTFICLCKIIDSEFGSMLIFHTVPSEEILVADNRCQAEVKGEEVEPPFQAKKS